LNRRELGQQGEEEAARYFLRRGWRILGRNVRVGRKELDLIVFRRGVLVFVEVQSRSGFQFGDPLEAISHEKKRVICSAAAGWLRSTGAPGVREVRFDAVGVLWPPRSSPVLQHIPDAWRMG